MTTRTSFGQWLRQRRKALDITQDDLAGRIGCTVSTLYKIEADERRPSRQIATLLAEHLNIPPDERDAFVRFARAENAASWGAPFHPPTNLPVQPTLLIGREQDVSDIYRKLKQPTARLLTLTGPPGIGKTRLAQQVAGHALDDFVDGAFFIALAPISDAALVTATIASTLGVPDRGPRTALERLQGFLRDKQILLLLDNFEQVLAAASQIAELLSACPSLKILVTSRAPLRIRQERQIPVSALTVPDLATLPDADSASRYSAVTLFMERAQAVKPDFSLTPENAPTVAAICARLDGLPLAIELISARVKLLPPSALLERLGGRLMLQSDGLRDIEPRHRTLNAAIGWSYDLLNPGEQMLFRRLGVFVGGWTLEAAGAICLENVSLHPLDGLASLLDKNLIKQEAGSEGEPRFMMLETIREYGLGQLEAHGERADLRQRHTNYFLKLAEDAEAHAFGHEQLQWFDRLEVDWDNVLAALAWSIASETGLRLAAALGWFFTERVHLNEGMDWLERVLALHPHAPPLLLAKALYSAGAICGLIGDERCQPRCKQALALARTANDHWTIAWSLSHLGFFNFSNSPDAIQALDESIALFRELEDPMGLSHNLLRRAFKAVENEHDYPVARSLLEESLHIARDAGDRVITAWVYYMLGRVSWLQEGDIEQARNHAERSVALFREARFQLGTSLRYLAAAEQRLGNLDRAERLYGEAVGFESKTGASHPVGLAGLASVARARGQFIRAAVLLGTVDESVMPFMARAYEEIVTYEDDKAFVRDQLGTAAFAAAWNQGRAMTVAQVFAYALVAPP